VFVVEQNRDAQLRSLLTLETAVEKAKLRSLLHYSGLPISSSFIVAGVLDELRPERDTVAPSAAPPTARAADPDSPAVLRSSGSRT
jgi:2-oxoglutarate ferredoxin oxidoreductase subunit alpha